MPKNKNDQSPKEITIKYSLDSSSSKPDRSGIYATIAVALVTSIVSGIGIYKTTMTAERAITGQSENASAAIEAQIQLSERHIEIAAQNLIATSLNSAFSNASDYQMQKAVIRQAFLLNAGNIDIVIDFEATRRSGATIRALEEIAAENPNLSNAIATTLSTVQKVLFIDSTAGDNVYCARLTDSGRTNIDEIVELVQSFPIRIVGKKMTPNNDDTNDELIVGPTENEQIESLRQIIEDDQPNIIVMHLGSLEGFQGNSSSNPLIIRVITDAINSDTGYTPNVLIYTRTQLAPSHTPTREQIFGDNFPPSTYLRIIQLITGENDDEDCFRNGGQNGETMQLEIRQALEFGNLYRSTF